MTVVTDSMFWLLGAKLTQKMTIQKVVATLMVAISTMVGAQIVVAQSTATYRLSVRNDWSQEHHKDGAPLFTEVVQPHFSHLGGGTHNEQLVVWEEGGLSSPGMTEMQETGWVDHASRVDLQTEFDAHIDSGMAGSFLNYPIPNPWFPAGETIELEFEISESHPLITLASMLGPSPDWFVGVSGLELRDADGWRSLVEVDLYPHDGGTRSRDDRFALGGPRESPQQAIRRITDSDDTLIRGSIPIGRFTFELLSPTALDCDFDGDGDCDHADLDALYATGAASLATIDEWLSAASNPANTANATGNTLVSGDVNLDGSVDSVDLGLLLNAFGSADTPGWQSGNLDADDVVGSSDLGLLLNNFGHGTDTAAAAAATAVPEPNSVALVLFAICGWAALSRKLHC